MQEFITIPTSIISELPDEKKLALLDILLMADENGQIMTSERILMSRWKWGNTKVRNFIDYLMQQNIVKSVTKQPQSTSMLINTDFFKGVQSSSKAVKKQSQSTKKDKDTEIFKRIIEHLNAVCGTRYRYDVEINQKDIRARLNDGYKEEEFYIVIDKKAKEWAGTEQEKYLRPGTLFGNKFDEYLNQKIIKSKPKNRFNNFPQRDYDFIKLESILNTKTKQVGSG